jgi:hypothetical protein
MLAAPGISQLNRAVVRSDDNVAFKREVNMLGC